MTHHPLHTRLRSGRTGAFLASAALLVLPAGASAHGAIETPGTIWGAWNIDPLIIGGLLLASWWYSLGSARIWRQAGVGRGVPIWRAAAFWLGILTLFVALVSPVDALGSALFSGHMVQHLLLMLGAAALFVLAEPAAPLLWGLPEPVRAGLSKTMKRPGLRRAVSLLVLPLVAWIAHTIAVWLWHVPALYEAALASPWMHALEHASFFITALLFWWAVIHPLRTRHQGHLVSLLAVFTMALQGGALGVLIMVSREAWYPAHVEGAAAWNLSPVADQQLAGLIMWVPGGMVYLAAGLAVVAHWLRASKRISDRREAAMAASAPAASGI
jgi:putative membrane protein